MIDDLLGKAIDVRYEDFCRLSSGAFLINVSDPMAEHALRALNLIPRGVLAVPNQAGAADEEDVRDKLAGARKYLTGWGNL